MVVWIVIGGVVDDGVIGQNDFPGMAAWGCGLKMSDLHCGRFERSSRHLLEATIVHISGIGLCFTRSLYAALPP
jgi:hypothetical protein